MFNMVFDIECTLPDTGHQVANNGLVLNIDSSNELIVLDECVNLDLMCDTTHRLDITNDSIVIALQTELVELDVE